MLFVCWKQGWLYIKEDIDASVNLGLNHPMGPLVLADFLGLDTLYYIASSVYEEFKKL
jgi:3-hydroxybutyryl-CoA dehydrogenase